MRLGTSELGWHAANSELDGIVLPREEYRRRQVAELASATGKTAIDGIEEVYSHYDDNATGQNEFGFGD